MRMNDCTWVLGRHKMNNIINEIIYYQPVEQKYNTIICTKLAFIILTKLMIVVVLNHNQDIG